MTMGGINSPLAQNNQDLLKNPLEDSQKQLDNILAQGKKITGQIDNLHIAPAERQELQNELDKVDGQKEQAKKLVIVETQQELSAHIADLNNDRFV